MRARAVCIYVYICNINRKVFNNSAPEEITAVKPVRENPEILSHAIAIRRNVSIHRTVGWVSKGGGGVGGIFSLWIFPSPVVGTRPTLWIDLSISAASLRSPQIAFIRELRAALLCSFHFSIPL